MAEKRRRRESNSRQGRSPCPLSIREHAPSYPSISSLFYHPSSSSPDLPLLYSPYNQPLSSSITFLPRIFSSAFQSRSSIPPPLHLPLPRISSPLSIYPFIIYPGASSSFLLLVSFQGTNYFFAVRLSKYTHTSSEPAPEHRRRDAAVAAAVAVVVDPREQSDETRASEEEEVHAREFRSENMRPR